MVEVVNATLVVVAWSENVVEGRSRSDEGVEAGSRGLDVVSCWFDSVDVTIVEKGATVEEDEATYEMVDEVEIEMSGWLEIGESDCNAVLVEVDVVAVREVDPVGIEGGLDRLIELELCPIDWLDTGDEAMLEVTVVEIWL